MDEFMTEAIAPGKRELAAKGISIASVLLKNDRMLWYSFGFGKSLPENPLLFLGRGSRWHSTASKRSI
ncbi:MAG: hypothetical protein WBD58_23300 [Geitlerinemataceae cyanobacterium]